MEDKYPDWEQKKCHGCLGHGVTNIGYLEVVPGTCSDCGGSGIVWEHEPSGALARYPGGPFVSGPANLSKEPQE